MRKCPKYQIEVQAENERKIISDMNGQRGPGKYQLFQHMADMASGGSLAVRDHTAYLIKLAGTKDTPIIIDVELYDR